MDYYFWLKAAHLVAVLLFVGGLVLNGFLLRHLRPGEPMGPTMMSGAFKWNERLFGSALLLVWVFGLALVYLGGWHADGWFMVKFALVFLLSGLHGAQTAAFRRMARGETVPIAAILHHSMAITLIFIIAIVILVAVKPF